MPATRSSSGPRAPAAGATRSSAIRQLVLRDVLRDLVSHEVALRDYGVVIDGSTVDRPPPWPSARG